MEIINLIKNYELENANYLLYMEAIKRKFIGSPALIYEVKMYLKFDSILKQRIIKLVNSVNGEFLKNFFSDLFEEKNKRR